MTVSLTATASQRALQAFVRELEQLLEQGYTGNVTVRVQEGVIRNYRTEQLHLVSEPLAAPKRRA